ncbi:hypothetical protein BGV40_12920 [Methanosarcina sp. Ant1]|nr:hypothetical protein BGV40_12920 [Methanosarcina sp. Ant1]
MFEIVMGIDDFLIQLVKYWILTLILTESLDAEEAKDDLRRTVPDFDTYLENGQIEVIPYTHGYVKDGVLDSKKILNGWIEKTNQTLDSGYEGLRLSGNSFWLETHWEDFVCYEREVDSGIGKYHMMALCTYSLDNCNIIGIADLVSNHQFVLAKKEGKWARIDNSGRKRAEEAQAKLKETLDNSENLVKERTAELEESYKSLLENEIRLNEAQKMAHIGSWDWDIITDKMYWSDETYRIFEFDPLEFDATYDSFLNYIHPEDRDYVDNAVKAALNGEPYSIDFRIVLADGEECIVHAQSEVIFNDENIPIRMKGTVQDITERKRMEDSLRQSEALLSTFLEQLPVGIGLADTQGRWLVINNMFRRFVSEVIPSRDPENSLRWMAWRADGRLLEQSEWPSERALRGENITLGVDFLYTSDDERGIWTHVSSVPFLNEAGEITGAITVIQDIDEQKRTGETLEKIEKIRIKEIHHRIKNNLQVISSLLSLESERFSDAKMLETLRESQNRVASMALIHEELYEGDKIDTFDFAAYLWKLTSELFSSYNVGNNNISLNLDLEQVYLGMDTAIPLGIIVNELVSNALKHAFPAGSKGEIQIRLRKAETPATNHDISDSGPCSMEKDSFDYILRVADNGKGMPEEIDFENADSLGLKLVNILVEQIDGYIELKRDHGTEFTIWFRNVEE